MKTPTITVAIIEDDAQLRKILVSWITRAGNFHCVGDYASGEAAVAQLPAQAPQVVLTDINLPGINGVECVRRLKHLLPDTQFVMLTVYEDADHILHALQAGAAGYLLKQTPRQELLDAVREVHEGGSPMTTNIARKVVQSFQRSSATEQMVAELSPRESEVLTLLAQGYLYKEIADTIAISVPTVNTYIRRIYEKLHVRSRAQAVARFTNIPTRSESGKAP